MFDNNDTEKNINEDERPENYQKKNDNITISEIYSLEAARKLIQQHIQKRSVYLNNNIEKRISVGNTNIKFQKKTNCLPKHVSIINNLQKKKDEKKIKDDIYKDFHECQKCKQVIIPSPESSLLLQDRPSITLHNWKIFTVKKPILSWKEISHLNKTKFKFPLPEMMFGNNIIKLTNFKKNYSIEFNALDALDTLNHNCDLKIDCHTKWLEEKKKKVMLLNDNCSFDSICGKIKKYDWTYSVNYQGTYENVKLYKTDKTIPLDKLLKQDPILFYNKLFFFEDELGDNGISILTSKIRVMPTCLLLLCRFFLRIDFVIFRIRDTRIYIDFESDLLIKNNTFQEYSYQNLINKIKNEKKWVEDTKKKFRDVNWVSKNIPVIDSFNETNQENY